MLKLQLLTGPRKGRKIRVSDDAMVTIGRTFGRIRLHDSRCSKNHAEIVFDGDSWIFRDLGSANGTHINKSRVRGLIELESGDMIQIGRILIKVREANSWGVRHIRDEAAAPTNQRVTPPKPKPEALAPTDQEQTITGETAFGDDLDLDALFEEFENDEDIALNGPPQAAAPRTPQPTRPDPNEETAAVDAVEDSASDKIADLDDDRGAHSVSKAKPAPEAPEDTADLIDIADDATEKPGTTMVLPNETIAASAVTDRASLIAPPETTHPPMESQGPGEDSGVQALTEASAPKPAVDDADDDEAIGLASDEPVPPAAPPAEAEADEPEPEAASSDLSDLILIDDKRGETPITPPQAVKAPDPASEVSDEPSTEEDAEAQASHAPVDESDDQEATEEAAAETEATAEDAIDPPHEAVTPADAAKPESDQTAASADVIEDASVAEAVEAQAADDSAEAAGVENDAPPIDEVQAVTEAELPDARAGDASAECSPSEDVDGKADAQRGAGQDDLPDAAPSDLAHSQLDVAFIQQALADLAPEAEAPADTAEGIDHTPAQDGDAPEVAAPNADALALDGSDLDSQAQALGPDDTDYDAPKAQALSVPTGSSEAVADELDADDALEHHALRSAAELSTAFASPSASSPVPAGPRPIQPLPGQNPVSLVAPEEPRISRGATPAKRADRQRLLKTAALVAVFVGLGGFVIHYLNPNLITKITGRTSSTPPAQPGDTAPDRSNGSGDQSPPPNNPTPPAPPETTGTGTPTPTPNPDRLTPEPAVFLAGMPRQPDPFGAWPRVLGPRALSGRTTDDPNVTLPENPDLDPLPESNLNPDTPIILPNPGPANPDLNHPETHPPTQTTDATTDPAPETNQDPTAPADGDRLIFLVDCSGSLVDSLPQMLLWLDTATQSLAPGEQFTIIYFKNGNTQEILPTGFKPMSRSLREDLDARWLNPGEIPILPSGRSAPEQAMRLALSYEPSDIYLLSDEAFGRETGSTSQEQAVNAIADLIGDHEVRVHGVQFFYEDEAGTLQSIANQFGGTYEFIAETRHPDQPPIDLLEQLENRD